MHSLDYCSQCTLYICILIFEFLSRDTDFVVVASKWRAHGLRVICLLNAALRGHVSFSTLTEVASWYLLDEMTLVIDTELIVLIPMLAKDI